MHTMVCDLVWGWDTSRCGHVGLLHPSRCAFPWFGWSGVCGCAPFCVHSSNQDYGENAGIASRREIMGLVFSEGELDNSTP